MQKKKEKRKLVTNRIPASSVLTRTTPCPSATICSASSKQSQFSTEKDLVNVSILVYSRASLPAAPSKGASDSRREVDRAAARGLQEAIEKKKEGALVFFRYLSLALLFQSPFHPWILLPINHPLPPSPFSSFFPSSFFFSPVFPSFFFFLSFVPSFSSPYPNSLSLSFFF